MTGREISYARNEVLLRAFRRFADVDVVAVEQQPRSLWANSARMAARAALYLRESYDLVFIGFYGQVLVQLLRGLVRAPILFDAFISTYDTLCFDRRVCAPGSIQGRMAYWLDRASCNVASRVLLDTEHHVAYFVRTFWLPQSHFAAIPVGCSEAIYSALPTPALSNTTEVLSYTTFMPLHGVEITLRAASLLKGHAIQFRMIGNGPQFRTMSALAQELQLTNLSFEPPIPPRELAGAIGRADICLGGHFGPGEKAARVIPGKIYQMLAVGRAVIAADAPGNRELLEHGESAWLIPPSSPEALAIAVERLHRDTCLRGRLAANGHATYCNRASETIITARLRAIVERTLGAR